MRDFNKGLIGKIVAVFTIILIVTTNYADASAFSDVDNSKYKTSIENLVEREVLFGNGNGNFRPTDELTREEAASMIYHGFYLVPVYQMDLPAKEGEVATTKSFYTDETTVATLDSVIIPGARDTVGTWSETYANTVLEARIMDEDNFNFKPKSTITRNEFANYIAKAILGADKNIDFINEGKKNDILPSDIVYDNTEITREEAAYLLDYALNDLTIITVMSTSDIHGNMLPYKPSGSKIVIGGSARASYQFKEIKERNPNTLIVDGGDSPYNTDIANFSKGRSSVEVMNEQGYDATVLGNHDFDYEFTNLLELANLADYAMLSANTYYKDGTYPEELKPYIIKDLDGIKVAIVGLTDDSSKKTTHYTNTMDIDLRNHWEVGEEIISSANKEADLVIALAHMHSHNNELPKRIEGIDLEIAGGNDTFGRPILVEDTVIVNPGGVGVSINQTNLNIKNGELKGYTANQIFLTQDTPEDEKVTNILSDYKKELNDSMGEVIGQVSNDIPWSSPLVRTQESPLGNLAADALRSYGESDFAIMNGGGLRSGLTKGDITIGDIYKLLPFDNKVTVVEVTGKSLWDAIENGIAGYPETFGKFPQVSGFKYTFDGSKPAGERLVSIILDDGTALEMDKWYTLTINDFMAGGGDGYSMFNVLNPDGVTNSETAVQELDGARLVNRTSVYYRNAITKYIIENKTVNPEIEGRITILNPQENSQKLN